MPMTKRPLALGGTSRREFGKFVMAASAALGLGPTRALEILDDSYGEALAQTAVSPYLTINLMPGAGACSWFNFVWPLPRLISSPSPNYAYDDPTQAVEVLGNGEPRKLYVRKFNNAPLWDRFGAAKRVSIFQMGKTDVHSRVPDFSGNPSLIEASATGQRVQLYGAQAAIQNTLKTVLPVIGVTQDNTVAAYAAARGGPPTANNAMGSAGLIGLFNSLASTNELMNAKNQVLFADYFNVLLSLTRSIGHPLYHLAQEDAKTAVRLLARNLSAVLTPPTAEIDTWVATTNTNIRRGTEPLSRSLWVAAKAMSLGLCAQVNIPCFQVSAPFRDPHDAFSSPVAPLPEIIGSLMSVLHNLMEHLDRLPHPLNAAKKLSEAVVLTIVGDMPKQPFLPAGRSDWADTTPGKTNWIWVMSQGHCKPGWFGDMTAANAKTNYDPATGALTPGVPDDLQRDASVAAILYAVAGKDKRAVNNFYTGNYDGLIVP